MSYTSVMFCGEWKRTHVEHGQRNEIEPVFANKKPPAFCLHDSTKQYLKTLVPESLSVTEAKPEVLVKFLALLMSGYQVLYTTSFFIWALLFYQSFAAIPHVPLDLPFQLPG